jgi:hypothetical protein
MSSGALVSYGPQIVTDRKTNPGHANDHHISKQIDTLQRISRQEKEKTQGGNWTQEMRDFYNLDYGTSAALSYRPRVILPELQYLLMSESIDLTNDSPKVYISVNGQRDEQREKAFNAAWRLGMVNNRIFDAVLWSQFCNPGWLQVGFSPDARNGKGMPWVRSIDPDSLDPDPHAQNDKDWSYVINERWFYVDEIRRQWPEQGMRIRMGPEAEDMESDEMGGSRFDLTMDLPPGPLRMDAPDGFLQQNRGPRAKVRYLWVKDYAREVIKEIAGEKTAQGFELTFKPSYKWRFPFGRFVTECNGIILADGPNFIPKLPEDDFGTFPFVGVWSLPHLGSMYGPPPVRYGRGPQDIAEKMYTQLIENMIRTNNGQYYIPRDSNIDIDTFGGLPGEVLVYDGDKPPTQMWPNAIPQHMTQIPEVLLQKVARYVGFTPERQGQSGGGNISPELFDASLFQSQSILRMKARLLSESYQRLTSMMFYLMARMKLGEDTLRGARSKEQKACTWSPLPPGADCDLELDETSIDAMSSAMMKNLVMALAKTGLVPQQYVLETLGVPNAEQIAKEAQKQAELAALNKLRKPR